MVDQEAWVRWNVDLSKVTAGTTKLKAQIKSVGIQTRETAKDINRSANNVLSSIDTMKAGYAALGAVISSQMATAAVDVAKFADSAAGVDRYFERSFGDRAEEAREWAEALSDSYGVYSGEVEAFMARMNDGFRRAGNNMRDSYDMARDFTALSYDIAKVYSGIYSQEDIADWLNDLAVGGGEEALEKLLPGFDEETLKAKAYEMELAEVGKELSVLAKQQAAYQLLLEEYSDNIGSYAQESYTASSGIRELNAATDELKETLGQVLSPAVWVVAKSIGVFVEDLNDKVEEVADNLDRWGRLLKWAGNGIAEFFGWDKPFADDEAPAVAQTDALNRMLAAVTSLAKDANRELAGLLGFDRLNILKTASEEDTDRVFNADDAASQWLELFLTAPDTAADAMDALWESMIDSSATTTDGMRKQFGQYFEWLLAEDLENTELTVEERQRILAQFYDEALDLNALHREQEEAINAKYDEMRRQAELGTLALTLDEIEAMRLADLDKLEGATEDMYSLMYAEILTMTGQASKAQADAVYEAYSARIGDIKGVYEDMFAELKRQLEELKREAERLSVEVGRDDRDEDTTVPGDGKSEANLPGLLGPDDIYVPWEETLGSVGGAIADGLTGIVSGIVDQAEKEWNDRKDSFNSTLKKLGIGDGVGWFANGGVFEPNNPRLIGVGDNTREREVIAPESMIEAAVERVLTRHQGSNRPMEITVISQIDGRQVAKATYKYTQQEALRRGKTA